MLTFITNALTAIGNFVLSNWLAIAWLCFAFYMIQVFRKSEIAIKWLLDQIEWLKGFFVDDDDATPNMPSHKNLVLLGLTATFIVTILKKVIIADAVPDIPAGWQLVLIAGLGITAAKSTAQKLFENKWPNGKSEEPTDQIPTP